MIKYAIVVDDVKKTCNVGIGDADDVYEAMDMTIQDVEEFDGQWYLTGFAPTSSWHQWDGTKWIIPAASRATLILKAKDIIDAQTDDMFINGFVYADQTFKLTLENQMNFKTECEMRDQFSYPHRVKTRDGYFDFTSADQYLDFYMTGVLFKRQLLTTGWAKKDALINMTANELIAIVEPKK